MVRQILKNIFSNWIIFGFGVVINLAITPLVVRSLGKEYYGIWMIINSLVGYMNIMDFGIRPAVTRYVAKYIGLRDDEGVNNVLVSSLLLLSAVALVCVAVTCVVTWQFEKVYQIAGLDLEAVKKSVFVVGLSFAVSFPMQAFAGLLSGFERFDLQNGCRLVLLVVKTALVYALLTGGGGIYELALLTSVVNLLQYLADIVISYRVFPKISYAWGSVKPGLMKELLGYGIWSFLIQISLQVTYYLDVTLVGVYISSAAVAVYAISGSLVEYSRQLVSNMTRVFTPALTKSFYRNDLRELTQAYLVGTNYAFGISLPLVVGLVMVGKDFIRLWLGEGFSESYHLLLILLIPQVVGISQQMSMQLLGGGMGRNDKIAKLEFASASANLLLSLLLVRHYGMIGVAVGTAIPLFLSHSVILPLMVCRKVHCPLSTYLKEGFYRGALNVLPMTAFLGLCKLWLPPIQGWTLFSAVVSFAVAIYLMSSWRLLIDAQTRARIRGLLASA